MVRFLIIFILTISTTYLAFSEKSRAQELAPPAEQKDDDKAPKSTKTPPPKLDSNFTGTLAEDDPDNQDSDEIDKQLFGTDSGKTVDDFQTLATHTLKFQFKGQVQFVDAYKKAKGDTLEGRPPYMEIEYSIHFDVPVIVNTRRFMKKVDADYDVQNWGALARNEFFECKLEITLPDIPVELVARMNVDKDENGDVTEEHLALKLSFPKTIDEDWFSFCSDPSGSKLNTKGDTEHYSHKLLEMTEPLLSGIVIDNFDPMEKTTIRLDVPDKTVTDEDIANDITYSGEGTITLNPL